MCMYLAKLGTITYEVNFIGTLLLIWWTAPGARYMANANCSTAIIFDNTLNMAI